jgi:hypothetical protein
MCSETKMFKIEFLRTFLRLILIALRVKRLGRRQTFGEMIIIPPSSGFSLLTIIFENRFIARNLEFLMTRLGASKQLNLHGAMVQFLLIRLLNDVRGSGQPLNLRLYLNFFVRRISFRLGDKLRQDCDCGSWASITRNLLDIPFKHVIKGPHDRFPCSMESMVFGLRYNMRLFHPWYIKRYPSMLWRIRTPEEEWKLPDEKFIAQVVECVLPGNSFEEIVDRLKRKREEDASCCKSSRVDDGTR